MTMLHRVFTGTDLDVLPGGTVVLDSDGLAHQRDPEHLHWQAIGDDDPMTSEQFADEVLGQFGGTVIWQGPA